MRTKKISSLIAKKAFMIAVAALISVALFFACSCCFYTMLKDSYHNDTITPLHTVSGKCTAIDHKHPSGFKGPGGSFQIFTIDGKQYSLNLKNASYTSTEDYTLFEEKALAAESITVQYVIDLDGDLIVQGLEIPGDRRYVFPEDVMESNQKNSNIGFVMLLFFYLAMQVMIIVLTHFKLGKHPSVKTALRKAKRKKERAVQAGKSNSK